MKKTLVFISLVMVSMILSYCSSSRRAARVPKSTFSTDLTTVIQGNCAPCHIPDKGGNKKAYDNYENVKTDIDEMIRRISLNPDEKGFMPFRKKEKLPAEVVASFQKWKDDGMLEK